MSGPGNLVKQVNDFKKLAPSIRAELASHFTEKAELEINYVHEDDEVEQALVSG